MGQVTVQVNSRSFAITCDDGQEGRIRRLAQYVDAKVAGFVGNLGQVGEARLLLLAALVIADELSDANDALQQERNRAQAADTEREAAADAAANGVQGMAKRVEAIAERLKTP
jgi:cell division protein ZapA